MKPYNKNLKQASRDLRNHMTEAEKLLWSRIRNKQILDLQFYRQKPILNYIVDFYCPAANLVIECDGSQHFTNEGLEADRVRDEALVQLGLKVFRFDNGQVMTRLDDVVEVVYQSCLNELSKELPLLKYPPPCEAMLLTFDKGRLAMN